MILVLKKNFGKMKLMATLKKMSVAFFSGKHKNTVLQQREVFIFIEKHEKSQRCNTHFDKLLKNTVRKFSKKQDTHRWTTLFGKRFLLMVSLTMIVAVLSRITKTLEQSPMIESTK